MCSFSTLRGLADVLGHVSGAGEGQWPVSSCGRTEEVAGDWWAGFVAGNERVSLEEFTAHWVPVEYISVFSATPIVRALINVGNRMYVPYPTMVRCPFGDNAHAN